MLKKKLVPTVSFELVFKAGNVNNARYETGATILNTNQPFAKRGGTFANNMVAAAIVDRLSHHNELTRITGTAIGRTNANSQSVSGFVPEAALQAVVCLISFKRRRGWVFLTTGWGT